ncbi:MAG: STN domain-containing protein, partial [Pseudomonadales bacterium]|nr:STN domain-containing protein [Pseudomonadales bacterium]
MAQATAKNNLQPVQFHIEPSPLVTALEVFAKQANIQLLYQSELITNQSFMGLHGKFQVSIALEKLLSDSGLTYRKISNTTYTVHKTRKRLDDSTHRELLSFSAPKLNIPEIITTGQSRKD